MHLSPLLRDLVLSGELICVEGTVEGAFALFYTKGECLVVAVSHYLGFVMEIHV